MENEKVRLNITLPQHLVEFIDYQVKLYGFNRSSAIGLMVKTYMQQEKSLDIGESIKELVTQLNAMQASPGDVASEEKE